MSVRRDWLLQQMGITQYRLRRPQALQGDIVVTIPPATRLLIVASVPPAQSEPLVADVLKSLMLTPQQVFTLTPDQLAMVNDINDCPRWYLGIQATENHKVALLTPALDTLYYDAGAKRALWQQICQYEQHFFTDSRRSIAGV
ncbi:DNA polymerase III subunit psi [Erwinia sp. OLTSP20]|uniref:DNA polymerase III subunit psi n=1 Tax=unclassified Erwinia TaxID=2622719 RepID=UPI000C19A84A|nr:MULTISPECIES: DNA polymerase III subunit psi [unclassified Erwinia]PIJ50252.1 DNA polymerase III subunit psi [Erwinia sp. OAMSP11]PIJ72090.1 DNA polymerase III subunit psi [Erwinia sp. OLSSP12]PIJ81381.1 DNA polymerase III subunit psi [Erwinia sp. OLCASP19]PIJ84087.1 DNA polymerase III subunit psi [Erwinia sp. OLMTSP26]PIJ85786.1 DNA polymerase III subunit psi [Erwinia sp. OLMDSP33]